MILPLPGTSSRHPHESWIFGDSPGLFLLLQSLLAATPGRRVIVYRHLYVPTYITMSRTHHALVYFFCSASQPGVPSRPAFDNRADVPDRHDKRARPSRTADRNVSLDASMKEVKGTELLWLIFCPTFSSLRNARLCQRELAELPVSLQVYVLCSSFLFPGLRVVWFSDLGILGDFELRMWLQGL